VQLLQLFPLERLAQYLQPELQEGEKQKKNKGKSFFI
tara:strand:- start:113 stop:223 length:111 start_codon:yes stop_codon:yes gene_type:complete